MAMAESQHSDVSMGDAGDGMTDSQLDREAAALLAADTSNDRLPDALATEAVGPLNAVVQPEDVVQPAAGNSAAAAEADATGENDSSNGPSSDDDDDDEEPVVPTDIAGLMDAGNTLMSHFASSQQSQMTADDDYEEQEIREEFAKIKTSTWMMKKLDKTTSTLSKLVKVSRDWPWQPQHSQGLPFPPSLRITRIASEPSSLQFASSSPSTRRRRRPSPSCAASCRTRARTASCATRSLPPRMCSSPRSN